MSTFDPAASEVSNEGLREALARNVRDALKEDIGRGDWTALLVPADRQARGRVVAKQAGVLCGRPWFDACVRSLDPRATLTWQRAEGERFEPGSELVVIEGQARALLSAERPALNFLQLLSATATLTRRYVDAIAGLTPNPRGCAVLDTRKTLPGLRQAQKYAVRTGGGRNQRLALWDGILIKENHIAAAGGIAQALAAAAALQAGVSVQIEVETLAEMTAALDAGARNILLDDFSLADLHAAHARNLQRPQPAVLEVSGGVDLDSIRDIARTGVDRISVGKLTKDIEAIDLSWRLDA